MDWFEETLWPDWAQKIRVKEVLYRERTAHQDLVLFDSFAWGRVLALDGVVQTTTADEFVYHEMLVHPPLLAHGRVEEVLIVGGGDGGCLREALRHPAVRRVRSRSTRASSTSAGAGCPASRPAPSTTRARGSSSPTGRPGSARRASASTS